MSSRLSRIVGELWGRPRPPSKPSKAPPVVPPEVVRARTLCRGWPSPAAPAATSEIVDATNPSPTTNPLLRYFEANREGPGIWKWEHYFEIYHRHLAKFMGSAAHVVEIGVYSGGSLGMWQEYFGPRCRISGIDIQETCRSYAREGVEIFIGDQADRQFWRTFRDQAPPMDIVLDDGGHEPQQQMVTLEETLPYLKPGGVYICEDIHGTGNRFAAFAQTLADNLNAAQWRNTHGMSECDVTPFQSTIHSVHCYPFLVVIETHATPIITLRTAKRGTQWQPFL